MALVGKNLYFVDNKNDTVIHKMDIFNMHLVQAESIVETEQKIVHFDVAPNQDIIYAF